MNADGTCNRCGAAVVWTITEAGKMMPVDPLPREWPVGRVDVYRKNGRGDWHSRTLKGRPEHGNCYTSHFATCTRRR